jgi:hypothetical protein
MNFNNSINVGMTFAGAWSERETSIKELPSNTEFLVEVKNTWSKELRLASINLSVAGASEVVVEILDNEKRVSAPKTVQYNWESTYAVTPERLITHGFEMETDITIPAGGTRLLKVKISAADSVPHVKANVWQNPLTKEYYLVYEAKMIETEPEMSSLRTEVKANLLIVAGATMSALLAMIIIIMALTILIKFKTRYDSTPIGRGVQ